MSPGWNLAAFCGLAPEEVPWIWLGLVMEEAVSSGMAVDCTEAVGAEGAKSMPKIVIKKTTRAASRPMKPGWTVSF